MRCIDAGELLSAMLDDELPAAGRCAVVEHVERCPRCSTEAAALRNLKHAVARLHAEETPPAAVRAHIETLRFARKGRAPRRLAVAAVAALLIALAAMILLSRWQHDLSDVVAADHLKSNPAVVPPQVVTKSPLTIERFFSGATRFNPTVPRLTDAEVLGARLCHLDGETAELIFYRHRGRNVSVFVTAMPPRSAACTKNRGLTVCREERNGLGIYAVSDLPETSLRRLLGRS
jgi:anti-sigma factor RsiW